APSASAAARGLSPLRARVGAHAPPPLLPPPLLLLPCLLQQEYYTYNSCYGGCQDARACGGYANNFNVATGQRNLPVCFQGSARPERFHK
ncbi:MAG: hypothetical protein ACKO0N_05800, partial [Planctomycetota bacterium]